MLTHAWNSRNLLLREELKLQCHGEIKLAKFRANVFEALSLHTSNYINYECTRCPTFNNFNIFVSAQVPIQHILDDGKMMGSNPILLRDFVNIADQTFPLLFFPPPLLTSLAATTQVRFLFTAKPRLNFSACRSRVRRRKREKATDGLEARS